MIGLVRREMDLRMKSWMVFDKKILNSIFTLKFSISSENFSEKRKLWKSIDGQILNEMRLESLTKVLKRKWMNECWNKVCQKVSRRVRILHFNERESASFCLKLSSFEEEEEENMEILSEIKREKSWMQSKRTIWIVQLSNKTWDQLRWWPVLSSYPS